MKAMRWGRCPGADGHPYHNRWFKAKTERTRFVGIDIVLYFLKGATMANPEDMWQCQSVNCGYFYNPDKGDRKNKIKKGVLFPDLPEEFKCPVCGASRKAFRPLAGPGSVAAEGKD
jgi:rubredoxin